MTKYLKQLIESLVEKALSEGHFSDQQYKDPVSGNTYSIGAISDFIKASKMPAVLFDVIDLANGNLITSSKEVQQANPDVPGSPEFIARAGNSDTSVPILVVEYPEGVTEHHASLIVVDGLERVWQAKEMGTTKIKGYKMSSVDLSQLQPTGDGVQTEMCSVGGGGVSATGGAPLGMKMTKQHKVMASGDKPLPESIRGLKGKFDLRHFKQLTTQRQQEKYCEENLKELSSNGGTRRAYYYSSGKVLKILGHEHADTEQNVTEIAAFKKFGPEYIARIFDHDINNTWILVEPIRTFSQNDTDDSFVLKMCGIKLNDMFNFEHFTRTEPKGDVSVVWDRWIKSLSDRKSGGQTYYEVQNPKSLIYWKDLSDMGKELVTKYDYLAKHNVGDINRPDHWGWAADGRIVCIDPGMTRERKTEGVQLLASLIENVLDQMGLKKAIPGSVRRNMIGGGEVYMDRHDHSQDRTKAIMKKVAKNLNKKPYSSDPPIAGLKP